MSNGHDFRDPRTEIVERTDAGRLRYVRTVEQFEHPAGQHRTPAGYTRDDLRPRSVEMACELTPFGVEYLGLNETADDLDWHTEVPTFWHNVIGHPLLWLFHRWPTVAEWVHNHTEPTRRIRSGRG